MDEARSFEAHYWIIHQFIDGNGRTARKIDRRRYLNALEIYQTKDNAEPYVNFMLSTLNRSLKIMIDLLDRFKLDSKGKFMIVVNFDYLSYC